MKYNKTWQLISSIVLLLTLLGLISSCNNSNDTTVDPGDSTKPPSTTHLHSTDGYQTLIARANPNEIQRAANPTTVVEQPEASGEIDFEAPLRPLFAGSPRVDMKLLILSATANDPNLEAISYYAKEIGVPFDVLISTQTNLTENKLIKANGDGKYQGIILTELGLSYNNGGIYESSFSSSEWNLLWQYQREFNVRQISLSGFPGTFPEDYGLRYSSVTTTTTDNPINAKLSTAGRSVFSSLKASAIIPIQNAYTYLATTCGAACSTITTTPLLLDRVTNNVLAAQTTTADGREVLSLTMSHNQFQPHTGLLSYDLINWVTSGIFIGERRMYFSIDIDDWYLESEIWNPATNSNFPEDEYQFRIDAQDVYAAKDGVLDLRSRFASPNFNYNQVFNAEKAETNATRSCNANASLSQATLCVADFFPFISHTFTHAEMDFLNYTDARGEFENNINFAQNRLASFKKEYVVTGKHSGLGWYRLADAPTGTECLYDIVPGDPFCQFGLEASNKEMLQAAVDLGVKYLAANRGWQSHEAECDSCLLKHPLEARIKLVPRWPTNIFYNTSTVVENVSEFNYLYGPQGIIRDGNGNPFFSSNKTWAEIIGFETDIAMRHILSASPYPHFIHQANLREYAPGRSLTYDFAEDVLKTYSSYFDLPLISQDWEELTTTLEQRTSFFKAGASGVINKLDNTVTITSANGGTVFVTGVSFEGANTFNYGDKTVSVLELSAGQSLNNTDVTIPAPGNLLTNGGFESNLTAWSSCGAGQTLSTTDANEASKAMNLKQANGASACLFQEVDAIAGKNYTFNCMAKRNSNSTWSSLGLGFSNSDYSQQLAIESKKITGSSYTLHSISLVAPTSTAHAAVSLYSEDSATFDKCTLSISTDENPPQTTNNLLSNPNFENNLNNWNLTGCGTGNVTSSTDASNAAKSMQLSGPTICVGQGVTTDISGNTSYTLSCDVKSPNGTYGDMSMYADDGTALGFKAITSSNYERLSVTGTTPAATSTIYVYFYKSENGSILIDNCTLGTP